MGAVKAGMRLDKLVAEKVMGWVNRRGVWCNPEFSVGWRTHPETKVARHLELQAFKPSTEIGSAWQLVEKLADGKADGRMMDVHLTKQMDGKWVLWYKEDTQEVGIFGETAPHAICLAALKAVE